MTEMRLATWNLAVPNSASRRSRIQAHLEQIDATVWVFTECHDLLDAGYQNTHSSDPGRDRDVDPLSRWVTIATDCELQPLVVSDSIRCAAARILPDSAAAFVVFGTVLPWIGSTWRSYPANNGNAFAAAVRLQQQDWSRIRMSFPDDEFFVIGDLNQDLADSHYYGSATNRAVLEAALREVGLTAMTAGAADPVRRDSPYCAAIDHICGRRDSVWQVDRTGRWPDTPKPMTSLSDHFGVDVTLAHKA